MTVEARTRTGSARISGPSARPGFSAYMARFNEHVARYIPDRSTWTPADEVIFGAEDFYSVPEREAEQTQFRAIRYVFERHYAQNTTYRAFCDAQHVTPSDISGPDDLYKIPLIPDRFFKDHGEGRAFASWLGNIYTGQLPSVVIRGQEPSFDDVVSAFNAAGLVVSYSSGTSGRHTVIPRDRRTYLTSQYAVAKAALSMVFPEWEWDMSGYLLMPDPRKTNVFAGRVCAVYFDAIKNVRSAISRDVNANAVRLALTGTGNLRTRMTGWVVRLGTATMVTKIIRWLEYHRRHTKEKLAFVGAPFILASVMDRLEQEGKHFDFAGRAGVITGGGWKIYETRRVSPAEFRERLRRTLGIEPHLAIDVYGMVEGNGWMAQCPEGHYFHVPTGYFKPLVLGPDARPVPNGQWGRFAFLDGAAYSYPGFIMTGDMVRLLDHCPACDRPGPVLESEIRRAVGEEMRGCGEEVRKMVSSDAARPAPRA